MTSQPNADWANLAKVLLSWKVMDSELEKRLTQAFVALVLPSIMAHRFGEHSVEIQVPSWLGGLLVVCQETSTVTMVNFDDEATGLPSKYETWACRRLQMKFRLDAEPRSYSLPTVPEPDYPNSVYWLESFGYLESHEFRQFLTKWTRRRFWPAPAEILENPVKRTK